MKQNIGISQVLNNEMNLCVPFNFLLFLTSTLDIPRTKRIAISELKNISIRFCEKDIYKVFIRFIFIILQKNSKYGR